MNHNPAPPGWVAIESTIGGERCLTLMEACPPTASPELRAAWTARKTANATGVCPSCEAVFTVTGPNRHQRRASAATARKTGQRAASVTALRPGLHQASMEHETGCVAGDDMMRRLSAAAMN
jgi:hypothetical protein